MNYCLIVQRTDQEKRRQLLISEQYAADDFPEHLNCLVQDINSLPGITAQLNMPVLAEKALITLASSKTKAEILDSLEHLFSREIGYILYVDLIDI